MTRPPRCPSILATIALTALFSPSAPADTFVSGTLTADTTWTLAQSPIHVIGDLAIPAGVSLTIEPGVIVRMHSGVELIVAGRLQARGTSQSQILFTTSEASATRGYWKRIMFEETSDDAVYGPAAEWIGGSILEHVVIEGAGFRDAYADAAVYISGARPLLDHITVRKTIGSGVHVGCGSTQSAGTLIIRNSAFTGEDTLFNFAKAGVDALFMCGDIVVENNVIQGYGSGVYVTLHQEPVEAIVRGNTVSLNGTGIWLNGIANARVIDNVAVRNTLRGLWIGAENALITGNLVRWNSGGAALFGSSGTLDVRDNTFANNSSTTDTGGLSVWASGTVSITRNIISSNATDWPVGGGADILVTGPLTFANNLLHGNTSSTASAAQVRNDGDEPPHFDGNTATENSSTGETTIWIDGFGTGAPTFRGNNLFNNITPLPHGAYTLKGAHKPIDATNTWWGTSNAATIQALIYDRADNVHLSPVDASSPASSPLIDPPISPPTGLTVSRNGTAATVSWKPNPEPDVAGYRVWYGTPGDLFYAGTAADQGPSPIDVGNTTSFTLTGLPLNAGVTVTAYDADRDGANDQTEGHESWYATLKTPVVIASLTSNRAAPQQVDTGIFFTANVTGGGPHYQYRWRVWDGNQWNWQTVWHTAYKIFEWNPFLANPNYQVEVWVRSLTTPLGPDQPEASAVVDFPINPKLALTSLTANNPSPQAVGSSTTFTATSTGGSGSLQYKWWIFDGSRWLMATGWVPANTFTWTPTTPHPGYRVGVWIRNAGSMVDASDNPNSNGSIPFPITATHPLAMTSLTANLPSPQMVGTSITFTATARGGMTPYQYKWWVYNGSTWSPATAWISSNTFIWTPAAAHPGYRVGVWIRSAGSTVDASDNANSNGSIPFAIAASGTQPLLMTGLTANRVAPQAVGTPVTFTATASGGTAPYQYKWWIFNGSTWTVGADWGASHTFLWTAATPHPGYRIGVWIRSATSTADASDNPNANGSIPFAITGAGTQPLVMTGLTSNLASPQAAGTPITFTATASGGTAPYQYKWWVYDGSRWTAQTGWDTSNTFVWTPATANPAYRVGVWIRSATSTADASDNDNSNGSIPFAVN